VGARTILLSQRRFTPRSDERAPGRWSVPLRIRVASQAPRAELLTRDTQPSAAGRCGEPLSVNADAIGFYRVQYDAATLAADTRAFESAPDGDRIALLDDNWALALAGVQPLEAYLGLLPAMGANRDPRAWEQIAAALGTLEHYERGTPGHDAFAARARALVRPVFDGFGWDPKPREPADAVRVRRALLGVLGALGDKKVRAEAQRRFALFLGDRRLIRADDQDTVLGIVAQYADMATFERLHALAVAEKDAAARRRYYLALMGVGDAALAARAAGIALSGEIPPQDELLRLRLVGELSDRHATLAWSILREHADRLLAPFPKYAPLITAEQIPEHYWEGAPAQEVEAWVRARLPAEMAPNIARGMESLKEQRAAQAALVPAVDVWVAQPPAPRSGRAP
jgi:aminopeptidase N